MYFLPWRQTPRFMKYDWPKSLGSHPKRTRTKGRGRFLSPIVERWWMQDMKKLRTWLLIVTPINFFKLARRASYKPWGLLAPVWETKNKRNCVSSILYRIRAVSSERRRIIPRNLVKVYSVWNKFLWMYETLLHRAIQNRESSFLVRFQWLSGVWLMVWLK